MGSIRKVRLAGAGLHATTSNACKSRDRVVNLNCWDRDFDDCMRHIVECITTTPPHTFQSRWSWDRESYPCDDLQIDVLLHLHFREAGFQDRLATLDIWVGHNNMAVKPPWPN